MRYFKIPDETVRRLPFYLRGVSSLLAQGESSISSAMLAEYLGMNPWQIRKDFSYFGDFGTRGVGYDPGKLEEEIKKILHLDVEQKSVLVGAGNLGNALLAFNGFLRYGFRIIAAFDCDPAKVGSLCNEVTIEHIDNLHDLSSRDIHLGIITVPEAVAQDIVDRLIDAGIRGILNFSSRRIVVPKDVKVITIDIAMDLARLPYYLQKKTTRKK